MKKGSSACLKCIFSLKPSEYVYTVEWFKDIDLIFSYFNRFPTFALNKEEKQQQELKPYKAALPSVGFKIDVSI